MTYRGFVLAVVLLLVSMCGAATGAELTTADRAFLEKKIIARWEITGKNQVAAAYARGVDILEDSPDVRKGFFTVLLNADELASLRADGYKLTVLEDDWYASYAQKSSMPMGGFKTLSEGIDFMDSLHAAYPAITSDKLYLGSTYEGREIWAMKISDNPLVDEAEPEVLFDALHHAREPITFEVLFETMRRLTFNYGTDATITQLVNEREIYFVPFVNPDGYAYNELIEPGGGGLWRKNRKDYFPPVYGVDPNRNYGFNWGFDDAGSSPDPDDETYRGLFAFSEEETSIMRAFINSRQFVMQMSYHSYSNLMLYPPGSSTGYTPDDALFSTIADSLVSFNGYLPEPIWGLYLVNGSAIEWSYYETSEHPEIYAFTPEVGNWFWPEPFEIPGLIEENQAPNMLIISLADQPERIFPPAVPTWVDPDTVLTADYDLEWSDPGGLNGAVSFRLREIFGLRRDSDDAETGGPAWDIDQFSSSTARAFSGIKSFYSGASDGLRARMTSISALHVAPGDSLRAKLWFDIETDYDYAYVEASNDNGQTWATLAAPGVTTNLNPNGPNRGNGITGFNGSGGVFVTAKFSLAAYVGQDILVRLSYETDGFVLGEGIYFDDINPVQIFDSVVTLAAATPASPFAVTGKTSGTYWYDLQATDAHNQKSLVTAPHAVVVNNSNCDCNCHADPICDGFDNILDVVETISVAFRAGAPSLDGSCPHSPAGRTDANCSGTTDIVDVVLVVGVAFRAADPAASFCDPCAP